MALGTAGGLATGVSLPIFNVIFGQLLDKLNESGSNFTDNINRLCVIFVYIAIGGLFAGFFQVQELFLPYRINSLTYLLGMGLVHNWRASNAEIQNALRPRHLISRSWLV